MNSSLFIVCILALSFSKLIAQGNYVDEQYLASLLQMEFEESIKISKNFTSSEKIKSGTQLAQVLYERGQSKLIKIQEVDSIISYSDVYHILAKGYQNLYSDPNTAKAFELFNTAYRHSIRIRDKQLEKFAIVSILEVFNVQVEQTNDNSLEYLNRLRSIKNNFVDEYYYRIHVVNFNLKDVFLNVRLNSQFFDDFDRLMLNFPKDHRFWPNYYSSKGVFYESKNNIDYDKAEYLHNEAIKSARDLPFLKFIKFRSYIRLSEIHKNRNEPEIALKYIDSSESYVDLADTTRSQYYLNNYSSDNYAALGKHDEAYATLRRASELKALLDYEENAQQISRLDTRYQTAEKEKQILIEQQRATKIRNWLIAAGLALLFGSGIAFLLQQNTNKKRKLAEQEALIEQQKVATLLKEQELTSIDAMISGQEKERTKVANELHDDLGSLMATVKLHFDNVKVDQKDPALMNAQKLLDEAYQKIRGMAHAKNSGVMANQGLLPAVKKMAKTINETNALKVTVEDFGLGERMENSLELTVFRIIQELIANIIKHSKANTASIQFTQHEDRLNIIVEDNGKGFNMAVTKRSQNGMGLGTIEKRIEHLEGTFTVDSIIGKGTSILIDIPV